MSARIRCSRTRLVLTGLKRLTRSAILVSALVGGAGAWSQGADLPEPGAGPTQSDIDRQATYDPGPELQRTPGGSLIVNAFILEGPVRVEIRDRDSDELLFEKEDRTLFPFEVASTELGTEPERVLVRIFIRGHLSHELKLEPGSS